MFGEDPTLTATLVVESVNGIQSQQVVATAKHYIDNDQEYYPAPHYSICFLVSLSFLGTSTNLIRYQRFGISVEVDERTQHELYCKMIFHLSGTPLLLSSVTLFLFSSLLVLTLNHRPTVPGRGNSRRWSNHVFIQQNQRYMGLWTAQDLVRSQGWNGFPGMTSLRPILSRPHYRSNGH